jgi:hypothetical protein
VGLTPEPWWLRRLLIASLPCGLRFFHEVGAKLLVEIGPERGRRHNNPLKTLPFSEGNTAEGPLGDGRNALLLLLPLLSMLCYTTNKLLLPLLLQLPSNTMKENEALRNRKPRIKLVPSELSSY